ncbi:MAG: phage tail length tape measure family protein [Planctomycetia bacterium]|nr:phage tail length tape measure family protein [Planctomycetia bacterium]
MDIFALAGELGLNVDGLKKGSHEAEAAIAALRKDMGENFDGLAADSGSSFGRLTGKFGEMTAALGSAMDRIKSRIADQAMNFAIDGIHAFAEAEASEIRASAAIRATGNAADFTLEQMKALATQIHETSKFEDDAALSTMALLASMKEIKGDVFRDTMVAAVDMASALGMSLEPAVTMLGKALTDPERGMALLRRQGVAFTDEQTALVKRLMASGDTMKAQQVILDELKSRYAGTAKELNDSLGGSLDRVNKKMGDMKERIGEELAPSLRDLADTSGGMIDATASIFGKMFDGFALGFAMFEGDVKRANGIQMRLEAKAMEADAQWAARSGDMQKAKQLRDEAKALHAKSEAMLFEQEIGPAPATKSKPSAAKPGQPVVTSTGTALVTATSDGSSTAAAPTVVPIDRTKAADAAVAFAGTAAGKSDLASVGSDQARSFISGMQDELKTLAPDLKFDFSYMRVDDKSKTAIDDILRKYKASLELMPGYNAKMWDATEARVRESLHKAAKSEGEQRAFHLASADSAVKASAKMFDAHDERMEQSEKKAKEFAEREAERAKGRATPLNLTGMDGTTKAALGSATHGESLGMFKEMADDIRKAMTPKEGEAVDVANIETMLVNYRHVLSKMPDYSDEAFMKIRNSIMTNATASLTASAEMQKLYFDRVTAAASKGAEVFAKAVKPKAFGEAKPTDDFASLQKMTRNELQKKIASSGQQFQNALGVAGISPEQKRGLKSLSDEYQATMVRIKNSTGDARAANIEQLKVITDAWAKTYQAIRDGSKKTVEQLIADAKKEGDIGKQTAGQRAISAKEKRQNIIAARQADDALMGGGGGGMMDSIFGMAQQISSHFSNAMSGIGAGMATLEAVMQQTTDPVAKLGLAIDNVAARMEQARINAASFGGGIQALNDLQKEMNGLQQHKMEVLRQEAEERVQAEKVHTESYKARELEKEERAKQARREAGYDLASLIAVGDKKQAVTFNIYGAGDVREQADRIEHEMIRRGINVGAKRSLDNK